jgi:hypothetical protein
MATNITGMVSMATAVDNASHSGTELEHLKNNIDDVYILTSGIMVCCE